MLGRHGDCILPPFSTEGISLNRKVASAGLPIMEYRSMGTALLENSPTHATGYRQRKPYLSPLYAILQDHFEHYVNSYEMRFQKLYVAFRSRLANVVYRFLDCGLFEAGFARLRCPGCTHEKLVPFSCKSKLCPSCTQKRVLLWAERIAGVDFSDKAIALAESLSEMTGIRSRFICYDLYDLPSHPFLVEYEEGRWRYPGSGGGIPLMFTIKAVKT